MICAILLAAGHSVRFGANKLLQENAAGISLASMAARALQEMDCKVAVVSEQMPALEALYLAAGFRIARVCSAHDDPGAAEENFSAAMEKAPTRANAGMSLSLRCGVAACAQAHGWIVALADMPAVSAHTVMQIAAALESGAPLVVCRYRGQRGHPVGFSRSFGPALMNLKGDQGGRSLLKQYSQSIHWLDVEDPGILFDVDTPADWQRWLRIQKEFNDSIC